MKTARLSCLLVCLICLSTSVVAQATRKVTVSGLIYDLKHPDPKGGRKRPFCWGRTNPGSCAGPDRADRRSQSGVASGSRESTGSNKRRSSHAGLHPADQDPVKGIQEKALEGIINLYVIEDSGFVHGVKKVADFLNPVGTTTIPWLWSPM